MLDLGVDERVVHVAPMLGSAMRNPVALIMVVRVKQLADQAVGVKVQQGLGVVMLCSLTR